MTGVQTCALPILFYVDQVSGLSTTLVGPNDYSVTPEYSVDWISNVVTLSSPLPINDILRIDVYEVGNGDQLVKSNTKINPIRTNETTGFNEIYVNCNYSGYYSNAGLIRPSTTPINIEATATEAVTNVITVSSTSGFTLNYPIKFIGAVFGNIVEDQTYYVKTVSANTNTITISDTFVSGTGVAGPTFVLTTDTGSMTIVVQSGTSTTYTNPIMYYNGAKLIQGITGTLTSTIASNDSIVCNSTVNMIVDSPIVFSDTMFGGVIVPQTIYYVKAIIDDNQFTISATQGGSVLALTDSNGGAEFVTYDYSFGLQPNGIQTKIIMSAQYNQNTDYLVYSLFGETSPQYGYTIPEKIGRAHV